jgi:hypothetical protein
MDRATASFENGMLRLEIPRAEQAKPRQIAIKAVTEATSAPADEPMAVGAGTTSAGQS